jgi:hypothetical protein
VSRHGRALPPGKGPPVIIAEEAGWAPEPVWTQRIEEKSIRPCRVSNLLKRSVNFHEILYGSNVIQGNLDAIIVNPIASIILKLLNFKVVRCALLNCEFRLYSSVTMATKLFTAVNSIKLN